MKKKIGIIILIMGLFILVGCDKTKNNAKKDNKKEEVKETKSNIEKFNGVYKKGEYTIHLVAIDDKEIRYYVSTKDNKFNDFGNLEYENDMASTESFGNEIKIKLSNEDIDIQFKVEEDSDGFNFEEGVYKKTSDYNIDEYYKDCYGKEELINSDLSGIYSNKDGKIYMYQPSKDKASFIVNIDDNSVSCEETVKDNVVECKIFDTKYKLEVNENKLTYTVSGDEDYKGTFEKEKITKLDIIKNFDIYQSNE